MKATDDKIHIPDLQISVIWKTRAVVHCAVRAQKQLLLSQAVKLDTRIGEEILDILRKKNKYPYHKIS